MAVADHDDARSAIAVGFDHSRIYHLAICSGTQSAPTQAKGNSDGEVAIGDDVTGVKHVEIQPNGPHGIAASNHAGSEGPMRVYEAKIAELMSVAETRHSKTIISCNLDHAFVRDLRVSDHAVHAVASGARAHNPSKDQSGSASAKHKERAHAVVAGSHFPCIDHLRSIADSSNNS